ncbi:MAG TPA: condensation domain-containing protein, partial [Steroidobacteraceae bacterium]|nr:condensation domain-containing protein [Steroidobacteraceae bacterium]
SGLLMFPGGRLAAVGLRAGWAAVRVQIDAELKARLREWCRVRGTTLAMAVFTIYAALVLRCCSASSGVIRYISDGRTMPEIQDAIGPFAAPLYLLVSLHQHDNFIDLLSRLTEQYCRAHAHVDFFHMQMREPGAAPARSCIFNWVAREPRVDAAMLAGSRHALVCSEIPFANPLYDTFDMDSQPMVLLYDRESRIDGEVMFARGRFPAATMERFAHNFLRLVTVLLDAPKQLVSDIVLD